jgi:hypothetical protein
MEFGAWTISRLAAGGRQFPRGRESPAADDTMQQSFAREMAEAHMRMHRDMARQMDGNVSVENEKAGFPVQVQQFANPQQ